MYRIMLNPKCDQTTVKITAAFANIGSVRNGTAPRPACAEEAVHDALRGEQRRPQESDDERADDVGVEEDRAGERVGRAGAADQRGEAEADRVAEDGADDGEDGGEDRGVDACAGS